MSEAPGTPNVSCGCNIILRFQVPANSRHTYKMNGRIAGTRSAIMVRSKTACKKIMVERSMYWNNRGAGTDTRGGYGD